MEILCIVPARSGSKGIRNKNLVELGGLPLIAHTLKVANSLEVEGKISKAIVSTDSDAILSISEQYGVSAPFLRPKELASDNAKSVDFVLHALDALRSENEYSHVLILQPTSPFRKKSDVEAAISMIEGATRSLISVYEEPTITDLVMYKMGDDSVGQALNRLHNKGVRRQEQEKVYVRNGAIYISDVKYIQKENQIVSDNPYLFVMDRDRSINIDSQEDLDLARSRYFSLI